MSKSVFRFLRFVMIDVAKYRFYWNWEFCVFISSLVVVVVYPNDISYSNLEHYGQKCSYKPIVIFKFLP